MSGNSIAGAANVARRIGAIVAMVVVLGLVLVLMWHVYLHHRQIRHVEDEPAVVKLGPPVFDRNFLIRRR
jgi:hypothetical protein